MRNLRPWLIRTLTFLALALFLAGCATTTTSSSATGAQPDPVERLLVKAGFKVVPADTPARLAVLEKMPSKNLVPHKRQRDGALRYVYADKDTKSLYVGDAAAYQNFINEAVMQRVEESRRQPMDQRTDDPEFWTLWMDAHGGG